MNSRTHKVDRSLSHGTVRNYLSECIGKLGVANRVEAYRLARQKGWL
ncbi:DNA-binding NarL/FixJ family response regulator [Stenotrophomonas sp. 2619]